MNLGQALVNNEDFASKLYKDSEILQLGPTGILLGYSFTKLYNEFQVPSANSFEPLTLKDNALAYPVLSLMVDSSFANEYIEYHKNHIGWR